MWSYKSFEFALTYIMIKLQDILHTYCRSKSVLMNYGKSEWVADETPDLQSGLESQRLSCATTTHPPSTCKGK